MSTISLTDLDCAVRLDWSLAKVFSLGKIFDLNKTAAKSLVPRLITSS